jgi:ankyrin repeat protein
MDALSLIHVAAYYDSLECFQYLVKKGLSPTLKSGHGFQPLHYAIIGFADEMVVYLLSECGADPNAAPEGTGFTPIYLSIFQKSTVIMNILFDFGAEFDITKMRSEQGVKNPVMDSLKNLNFEAFKLLLEKSPNVSFTKDEKQYSVLMRAISLRIYDAVEPLIELGVDVNHSTQSGLTALHLAIHHGSLEITNKLISYGADVNKKDPLGQTPVHYAAASGNVELLKAVLDAGADPLINDYANRTPLFCAVSSNNFIEIMKILLERGIDINHLSKNGTIIGNVVSNKEYPKEYIEFLLENGADLFQVAPNKKTYYQIAKLCCNKDVLQIVEKYAAIQQAMNK